MFNCNSKPLQGGKNGPWLHKVYMMSQSNGGSICRALSQILLLPRRKPYFSSATSPCETTRLQPGGGLCLYKRDGGSEWVSEWRRCVTSTNPSSTSVCVSVRGWGSCLIWCASQMTSVCLLLVLCSQQRTQKELSLSESCILSFLASPLLFLWKCLLTFFPH